MKIGLYIKLNKFLLIIIFFLINLIFKETHLIIKASFKHFIRDCFNLKKYYRKLIKVKLPYLSICIPAYNMKSYLKAVVVSILNQSFQNFEIIIVNDYSNDNTLAVISFHLFIL